MKKQTKIAETKCFGYLKNYYNKLYFVKAIV